MDQFNFVNSKIYHPSHSKNLTNADSPDYLLR